MTGTIKPLPCPYCGAEEIEAWDGSANFMECQGCQMTGPHAPSESSAIDLWNKLPRTAWVDEPQLNEWNRWSDGTCNNVSFVHADGTLCIGGSDITWPELGAKWFPVPSPEES